MEPAPRKVSKKCQSQLPNNSSKIEMVPANGLRIGRFNLADSFDIVMLKYALPPLTEREVNFIEIHCPKISKDVACLILTMVGFKNILTFRLISKDFCKLFSQLVGKLLTP